MAEKLTDLVPGNFHKKVWFGQSGSDASETVGRLLPLASGKRAHKVFKLKQVELQPGEAVEIAGKRALRQLSTRTYYPGPHAIEILANGRSLGSRDFELTRPAG